MLCIGVDASRCQRTRTGTETYTLQLLRHFIPLTAARGHILRLYVRGMLEPGWFGLEAWPPHVEVRRVGWPRLWTHGGLALALWRDPPDVLFIPAHVVPLWPPPALPIAVTVHDLGYEHYPQAHPLLQRIYLRWSTRHSAQRAQRVFADSQATASDLESLYGVPQSKVRVVYPGGPDYLSGSIPADRVQAVRVKYRLDRPYLLFLGTLQPRKNLLRLLDAFARVKDLPVHTLGGHSLPPPLLVIAGRPGWIARPILERARRPDVKDAVRILGYVPEDDLPALLQGAVALVFPSLYEGFGFPVLEAQALGVPVLTSRSSSLPEVAGDAALFVNPHDTEDIAEGLRRLLTDPALRRDLASRGAENVRRFSWKQAAHDILDELETIAHESCTRRSYLLPRPQPDLGFPEVNVLGVRVHRISFQEALTGMERLIQEGLKGYVVTVNPEIIMHARKAPDYRDTLNRAVMAWPDGIGVLWAAWLLGRPVPERVTGSDGIFHIAQRAARKGWRLYFLGARPGVAQRAAQVLKAMYPSLQIVGAEPGDPSPAWDEQLVAAINAAQPDILCVAYGAPKQERWIARNLDRLHVHVAIGVGGTFDFLAGVQKRAPGWMRRLGLEWLWRLLCEPWRWRRQRVLPLFVWLVLRQWWQERFGTSPR